MNARIEAAAVAIDATFAQTIVPSLMETAEAALAAADAVMFSEEAIERAAHELYDHREDALTCYDHDNGWCCICGEHEIEIPWYEHGVRAVVTALRDAPHATGGAGEACEPATCPGHGSGLTAYVHAEPIGRTEGSA